VVGEKFLRQGVGVKRVVGDLIDELEADVALGAGVTVNCEEQ